MADEERSEEQPRRARRARMESAPSSRPRRRPPADQTDDEEPDRREQPDNHERRTSRRSRRATSAGGAARMAAEQVAALTGHDAETVIAIERCDEGWQIGIEVVETHRIPDSADILASYEVRLEADGELVSYRRTRRYARGQLHGEGR